MLSLKKSYLIILAALTLIVYFTELHLLTQATKLPQVATSIGDEFAFYSFATQYNIHSGMYFGYGVPFWWLAKLIIAITPSDFSLKISVLRGFFLSLKYGAFIFFTLSIYRLKGFLPAVIFYLLLFVTPAFYFYGKVFSPEYMLLFFLGLSIWLLTLDEGKISTYFLLSALVAIMTVTLKISVLPFLLLHFCYLISHHKKITYKTIPLFGYIIIGGLGVMALGFLTPASRAMSLHWLSFSKGSFTSLSEASNMWYLLKGRTWDQITNHGLRLDFKSLLFLFLVLCSFLFKKSRKSLTEQKNFSLHLALFVTGLALFVLVLHSESFLCWYLFPPALITLMGLVVLCYSEKTKFLFLILLVGIVIVNKNHVMEHIKDKRSINDELARNYQLSEKINHVLLTRNKKGGVVLTDILVAFEAHPPLKSWVINTNAPPGSGLTHYQQADFVIRNERLVTDPVKDNLSEKLTGLFDLIAKVDNLLIYQRKSKEVHV